MTAPARHDGHATTSVTAVALSWEPVGSRMRPRWRFAWIWATIWLAYLSQPFLVAWHQPDPLARWISLVTLAAFAASFIGTFAVLPRLMRTDVRRGRLVGGALVGLAFLLATVFVIRHGQEQLPIFVYVAVMSVFLLPGRWGPVVVTALVGGTALAQWLVPGWHWDGGVQFQILVGGMAMWGVVQIIQRNRELDAARQEIARLAVEDERNRFARDLHDILGHSLTVVAVKAELAGRLVRLDPDRAEAEITDVERLAREALADVRTAVDGYRDVTLAAELANARSALSAAGIDADLPNAIDDVPVAKRELFGWVVREGVTNVVRHSGASTCRVRIDPTSVTITDDGVPATPDGLGHGLRGLRERAEALGGSLQVGRSPEGGFALTVKA
jgi:two-component system sensor histidine kinase DesK